MLNNEMDDFAIPNRESAYGLPPSPANMLAPGLQPLSSMVPSIVVSRDGVARIVLGAAGGTKITTQVALVSGQSYILKEVQTNFLLCALCNLCYRLNICWCDESQTDSICHLLKHIALSQLKSMNNIYAIVDK